jgi:hypothetical protein
MTIHWLLRNTAHYLKKSTEWEIDSSVQNDRSKLTPPKSPASALFYRCATFEKLFLKKCGFCFSLFKLYPCFKKLADILREHFSY